MLARLGLAFLLLCAPLPGVSHAGDRWILVDTVEGNLQLHAGDELVLSFPSISFGRGGVSDIHMAGDQTTPRGEFHITRVNESDNYHLFIGLDYPTMEHVDAAHRQGLIDDQTYGEMLDYAMARGTFPHDSPLGGHIGIHGLGRADPDFHKRFHWTQGCIALTDAQVESLADLVQVGMPVVIR